MCSHQRGSQVVGVLVLVELAHRSVDLGAPCQRDSRTVSDRRNDRHLFEVLHRGLLVRAETVRLDVGTSRDRSLDLVERRLGVGRTDEAQPILGCLGVLGAGGQGEGVSQEIVDDLLAGHHESGVVGVVLLALHVELRNGPVTHDVVGSFAGSHHVSGSRPVVAVGSGIGEGEGLLVVLDGRLSLGAVPCAIGSEKLVVAVGAHISSQNRLEEFGLSPGATDRQRGGDARRLNLLHISNPALDVSRSLGDAGLLEEGGISPHHIGAVDVDRHRIDVAIDSETVS